MSCKEEFIEIFKEKITRPGADALLNYLENKSDFFTAPASATRTAATVAAPLANSSRRMVLIPGASAASSPKAATPAA